MPRQNAFPNRQYPAGDRQTPGFPIAAGVDYIRISAAYNANWTEMPDLISAELEASYDGGLTWELFARASCDGNPPDPAMADDLTTGFSIGGQIRNKANPDRQLRARFVTLANLRTQIDVDIESLGLPEFEGQAPASVSFDATASVDYANVSSTSWTHTPSGTPTGVGVGMGSANSTTANSVMTAATYGGTSMLPLAVQFLQSITRSVIVGLANPASGAQTVALTFTGTANYGAAGSITVVGGDTTTLFSNTASAGGTADPASVTCTSATNELVMDCLCNYRITGGPVQTVDGSQLERWNRINAGSFVRGSGSTEAGAATVSMDWGSMLTSQWALCAASFKEAGGGGGGDPPPTGSWAMMGAGI